METNDANEQRGAPLFYQLHNEPLFNKSQISRRSSVPRAMSYQESSEILQVFNRQIEYERLNSTIPSTELQSGVVTLSYEPILGYDNLDEITTYSSQYSVYEITNRLSELKRAVEQWDLVMLQRLMDNARFDVCLQSIRGDRAQDMTPEHRRVVKRMVLEHVGSIVKPVSDVPEVKEKELNLIMLLNTL